jgi:hypothetical protein
MNDHAISRLIAKRAELARLATELEQELDQCRADLIHIDGALRILRADLDPETIPPRRRYIRTQYFGRNELSRLCMGMLREAAGEPLTAEEITLRIMTAKGLDARDARLRVTARVQVGAVLKRLSRKQIAMPSGKGAGATWRLLSSG